MKEWISKLIKFMANLLNECLFATDGRFLRKENALYFYKEYFNDSKHILFFGLRVRWTGFKEALLCKTEKGQLENQH